MRTQKLVLLGSVVCLLLGGAPAAASPAAGVATTYTIGTQADFNAISARTYQPGDRILFRRGATFVGNLTLRGSGTAADPIVLDATGDGPLPQLIASGANPAMRFTNVSHYLIQNLDVSAPAGAGIDIQVTAAATADVSGFTIRHSTFHDIHKAVDTAREMQPEYNAVQNKAAIMVGTWHTDPALMTDHSISDVVIDGCEFFDVHNAVYVAGNISLATGVVSGKPRNRDIVTRNSYFHNIVDEGTVYLATVDSLITDNSYINVSHNPNAHVAPVWMVGSSRVVIQRSYQIGASFADGMMIDFDWRTDNSIYQYNYSERNGEWAYPCSVLDNHHNIVRYNISFDDFTRSENCFDERGGERDFQVYNNTLVNFQGWNLHAVNAAFRNNAVVFTDTTKQITVTGSSSFANNLYVNHVSSEPGAVHADPRFVRRGTDPQGFKLLSGSPALDRGTVIPNNGGTDYYGNPLYNGSPDIGAAEYWPQAGPPAKRWNLAEGAQVTASSSIEQWGWSAGALRDGITASITPTWSNRYGYSSASSPGVNHTEWVVLDFGERRTFDKVVLWPRSDPGHVGQDFPRDFQIQVWDGANWITRVNKVDYPLDRFRGQEFTWGRSDTTDRIRILATELTNGAGAYHLQLADVQVFEDSNLAAGVAGTRITTSSSVDGSGWYETNLNDGFTSSFGGHNGWSSALGRTTQHQEWLEIELPCITSFSKVTLYPRNDPGSTGEGFPTSFQIQVWDGARWLTRVDRTGFPTPSGPQTFAWGFTDTTDKIRIVGTELDQVGPDFLMQFAEVEVHA